VKAGVVVTEAASTAKFDDTVTSSEPANTTVSDGTVNFASGQLTLTTNNGKTGPSARTTEIRIIGHSQYGTSLAPNLPDSSASQWFKTSVAQPLEIFQWVFVPLSNQHITASSTGTSNVQGTPTYVYGVHIPASTVDGTSVPAYEMQVWLDSQGRIRQAVAIRPGISPAGASKPGTQTQTQTLRLSHFGIAVAVRVPSPVSLQS
jgi:hypothetical protein